MLRQKISIMYFMCSGAGLSNRSASSLPSERTTSQGGSAVQIGDLLRQAQPLGKERVVMPQHLQIAAAPPVALLDQLGKGRSGHAVDQLFVDEHGIVSVGLQLHAHRHAISSVIEQIG